MTPKASAPSEPASRSVYFQLMYPDGRNVTEAFKVKVSLTAEIDDVQEAVKTEYANALSSVDAAALEVYANEAAFKDGQQLKSTEVIDETLGTKDDVLVVVVPASQEPRLISSSRHKKYKRSEAVRSCRAFLTNVATELDKIYPIEARIVRDRKRMVTIDDVMATAYDSNPEPKPEFRGRYQKKLNDFFSIAEWNRIQDLNVIVNPILHSDLPTEEDGSKQIVLPEEAWINGVAKEYQRIATKANVVADKSKLVVKEEGSDSGGTNSDGSQ